MATCQCGCACGAEFVAEDGVAYVSFFSNDFLAMQAGPVRAAAEKIAASLGTGRTLREFLATKEDFEAIRDVLSSVGEGCDGGAGNPKDGGRGNLSRMEFERDELGTLSARLVALRGKRFAPWRAYRAYEVVLDAKGAKEAIESIDRALEAEEAAEKAKAAGGRSEA